MKQTLKNKNELHGQVALVTGAGVRLGRAIALALAHAGCDLILHCRTSIKEVTALASGISALGRRVKVLKADFSKRGAAKKLADQSLKVFGHVDILVNSAAIFWPTSLENLSEQELETFLSINLKSPYVLSAILGRQMKKRGNGLILNMACTSAKCAWKNFVPYSISKAGIASLTVGMAKLLGPEVRVNAIAPGTVFPPEAMSSAQLRTIKNRLPLKKIGSEDDIVLAILYLCHATFTTGQILYVDGGRTIV